MGQKRSRQWKKVSNCAAELKDETNVLLFVEFGKICIKKAVLQIIRKSIGY
jgi:hypothetical protein